MKFFIVGCLLTTLVATALFAQTEADSGDGKKTSRRPLAHMVFFEVKDHDREATEKLVAACHQHLVNHEGTIYFSVGTRAQEMERDVNDTKYDVALHLVFESKAAHDKYADHPRHLKFIRENSSLWSGVRVFDSYLEAAQ